MKNKISLLLIVIALTIVTTACGTMKKAAAITDTNPGGTSTAATTPTDPVDAVIATMGNWQSLQCGGNISLKGSSSFSSAIQVRMLRDDAIFISLRPMLGIEVGKLLIIGDSLYAVDKVHKRYVAEKVSLLTAGIPVTVSDVQDIFLGRPFVIGKGSLNDGLKPQVSASSQGSNTLLTPKEGYRGYNYTFTFDYKQRILSLDIMPQGSTTAAYQVKYSDVKGTAAGNIAHSIDVNAVVKKKKLDFSLTYKNIEWNGDVKIDRNVPTNYTKMAAQDIFSLFSN